MIDNNIFNKWYRFMLRWEGGYAEPPRVEFPTNKGIRWDTFRSLAKILNYKPTWELFRAMPESIHKRITKHFWKKSAGFISDKFPCIQFIIAEIYWGTGNFRWIQAKLNELLPAKKRIVVDGVMGPKTASAIHYLIEKGKLNWEKLADWREEFLRIVAKRPDRKMFLRGWLNRLNEMKSLLSKEECKKKETGD